MGFYQRNNDGGGRGTNNFGFGQGFGMGGDGFGSGGGYGNNYSNSGGFFQGDGGGAGNSSMNAGGGDSKSARSTELVPVTIAEIKKGTSAQDKLRIGNVEVGRITLIAVVRDLKKGQAFTSYVLDDKSGATIEAKTWQNNDNGPQDHEPSVGQYVRIFGQVRSVSGEVSINVFGIQPVTDPNEIALHMLDVLYSHAILTQGTVPSGNAIAGTAGFVTGGIAGNAAGALGGDLGNYGGDYTGGGAPQGLYGCDLDVFNYIQAEAYNMGDAGADTKNMHADPRLKKYTRKQLTDALSMLSNEGHIYSTTDDDHYKTTVSDATE